MNLLVAKLIFVAEFEIAPRLRRQIVSKKQPGSQCFLTYFKHIMLFLLLNIQRSYFRVWLHPLTENTS